MHQGPGPSRRDTETSMYSCCWLITTCNTLNTYLWEELWRSDTHQAVIQAYSLLYIHTVGYTRIKTVSHVKTEWATDNPLKACGWAIPLRFYLNLYIQTHYLRIMPAVQIYDTASCDYSSHQISFNVFNYGCTTLF